MKKTVSFPSAAGLSDALVSEPVECKGINFRSFLTSLGSRFPDADQAELLKLVHPELAQRLKDDQILPSSWYPVAWYRSLHHAAQQTVGGGLETAWDIGYMSTRADFNDGGIYHFMARTFGPKSVLKLGSKIFGMYWRPAGMKVKGAKGELKARAMWTGCLGFDELIWHDIFGSIAAVLETSDCRLNSLSVLKASGDLSSILIEAHWE